MKYYKALGKDGQPCNGGKRMWYENLHPRHQKRIVASSFVMLLALLDFVAGLIGFPITLHWFLDALILWGAFSVTMTAVLLAMRYR